MRLTTDQLDRLATELLAVANGVEDVVRALRHDDAPALDYPPSSMTARLAAVLLDDVEGVE